MTPTNIHKAASGSFCINKQWWFSYHKYDLFPVPQKENHRNCPLYQYDMDGNFIKEWPNCSAVLSYYKKNLNIFAAIRLGQSCGGFQWSWEKVPFMKKMEYKSGRKRKVGKYTKEGELVQ